MVLPARQWYIGLLQLEATQDAEEVGMVCASFESVASDGPRLSCRRWLAAVGGATVVTMLVVLGWDQGAFARPPSAAILDHGLLPVMGLSEYIKGYRSEHVCPYGTVARSESECREVPNKFGGELHSPFVITSAEDPQGCFRFNRLYYYNLHPIGGGRTNRQVYCKRLKAALRFQRISSGSCMDYGFLPITQRETCEAAAWELQLRLADPRVHLTNNSKRPEGCYYFANAEDSTGTLWLSSSADSHGNGATESKDPAWMRQPVCVAQTTTMPPVLLSTSTVMSSTTATSSATSTVTTSTTTLPNHRVPIYIAGTSGSNRCPYGTVTLTESDCRQLPERFGGKLHHPLVIDSPGDPQGCFFFFKWYYYNVNHEGTGNEGRRPYCKLLSTKELKLPRSPHGIGCGKNCTEESG